MNKRIHRHTGRAVLLAAALLLVAAGTAGAAIDGITGTSFHFTVKADTISAADGNSVTLWGYADTGTSMTNGRAQYPGPTLILTEGDTVTVQLKNELTVKGAGAPPNVSIVFPGHQAATAPVAPSTGEQGLLTLEAMPGETVAYTFTATHPGTYLYHSGTDPELQVEMGLLGAIVVRPKNAPANYAYNHPDSEFDREYLFVLSEMDPRIHQIIQVFGPDNPPASTRLQDSDYLSDYFSNYWLINGRTAPDDMGDPGIEQFPTQPYNSVPLMHPGDRVLMRVVGANRDMHPFHHHGNHARVIARQGRLLESAPGMGADLSTEGFTINSVPGETVDAIFSWTGKGLNWDIYGSVLDDPALAHDCIDTIENRPGSEAEGDPDAACVGDCFDDVTWEYCPDHNKRFPVTLPETQNLAFGAWYSGSPYMGRLDSLPPGEGGLNPNGGFSYMWHSHTEKELTNYDIFPGGMLTMLIIEPPGTPID